MRSVAVARPLCWLVLYLKSSVFFWTRLVFLRSRSLPENDKPGAETCRYLILVVNCILLSAFVGWYTEYKNKRGMSNILQKLKLWLQIYNLWHSVWHNFHCQNLTLISQNLVYGILIYEQYWLTSQVKFIVSINKATNTNPNFPPVVHYIKFNLEQTTKAQRRNWGIALLFFLISALDAGGWSMPRPGRFTPGKDPVPIV